MLTLLLYQPFILSSSIFFSFSVRLRLAHLSIFSFFLLVHICSLLSFSVVLFPFSVVILTFLFSFSLSFFHMSAYYIFFECILCYHFFAFPFHSLLFVDLVFKWTSSSILLNLVVLLSSLIHLSFLSFLSSSLTFPLNILYFLTSCCFCCSTFRCFSSFVFLKSCSSLLLF